MDFPTHAGSNDGACAIWACMSINDILMEHGERITNMTTEVTGVPEVWTRFDF